MGDTSHTKGKALTRWFYDRSSSPPPFQAASTETMPLTTASYPEMEMTSSRVDSFPRPPASVEPPRVAHYLFQGSPAPLIEPSTARAPSQHTRPSGLSAITEHEPLGTGLNSEVNVQNEPPPAQFPFYPEANSHLINVDHLEQDMVPEPPGGLEELGRTTPRQPLGRRPLLPMDPSKPAPPSDVVQHVEATRHGTADNAPDASEQVEITPPIRRRTPPPAIVIDFGNTAAVAHDRATTNTSTWVSGPDVPSLAPPVNQMPMSTPGTAGLAPPLAQVPMSTPGASSPNIVRNAYDITRPTCSLNLVCYRGGSQGCVLRQLQTVLDSRFADEEAFQMTLAKNPQLIATDEQLFHKLSSLYWGEMSGFVRRYLSLKTLTGLRLLEYSPVTRPTVVPLDDFVLQEMYYAYKHPNSVTSESDWIEWVFRLRRRNKRHALEFVEGWNSTRVIIAGMLPWLVSCLVGIIWTATGGDAQTAFTVASFILTSGTVILALLAVISGIESSGRSSATAR